MMRVIDIALLITTLGCLIYLLIYGDRIMNLRHRRVKDHKKITAFCDTGDTFTGELDLHPSAEIIVSRIRPGWLRVEVTPHLAAQTTSVIIRDEYLDMLYEHT